MPDVRVLLVRAAGTNADVELAHTFRVVGAAVDEVHINALLKDPGQLERYQVLGFPGGFSYGDDIASGKILANQLIHHLKGPVRRFVDDGKLVIGICNGFQVLVKSGLLPGPMPQLAEDDWHPATLTYNTSGRYEDRWIRVKCISKRCAWLPEEGGILDVPVAHGEGRFVARGGVDGPVMEALRANDQVAVIYVDERGEPAMEFPALPNGSMGSVAGICDVTGRVFGLMPHPERAADVANHPLFTRGAGRADGLRVFESAMRHLRAERVVLV